MMVPVKPLYGYLQNKTIGLQNKILILQNKYGISDCNKYYF